MRIVAPAGVTSGIAAAPATASARSPATPGPGSCGFDSAVGSSGGVGMRSECRIAGLRARERRHCRPQSGCPAAVMRPTGVGRQRPAARPDQGAARLGARAMQRARRRHPGMRARSGPVGEPPFRAQILSVCPGKDELPTWIE